MLSENTKKPSENATEGNVYSVIVKNKRARKTKPLKVPLKVVTDLSVSNTTGDSKSGLFKTFDMTSIRGHKQQTQKAFIGAVKNMGAFSKYLSNKQ